jgi:hypothetical protein
MVGGWGGDSVFPDVPRIPVPTGAAIDAHTPWILVIVALVMLGIVALQVVFMRRRIARMEIDSMTRGEYGDDVDVERQETGASPRAKDPESMRWGHSVRSHAIVVDPALTAGLNTAAPNPVFDENMGLTCPASGRSFAAPCRYARGWWIAFRQDGASADALNADVTAGRARFAMFAGVVMRLRSGGDALRSLGSGVLSKALRAMGNTGDEHRRAPDADDVSTALRNARVNIVVVCPAYAADLVAAPTATTKGCSPVISLPFAQGNVENFVAALAQSSRMQTLTW